MVPPAHRRHLASSPFNAQRNQVEEIEVFEVGDRVSHDRHGLGRVTGVEGEAAVCVEFGIGLMRLTLPTPKLHKL